MHTQIVIPKGTDKVTVELTVKEAIALGGGVRFSEDADIAANSIHKKNNPQI